MNPVPRVLRFTLALLVLSLVAIVGGALYLRSRLNASLPDLNGTLTLEGLTAPATVERDGLGVPTITAATREDASRVLGFLHAQDRFFQMDLQRRQPAGELSVVVGSRALEADAQSRVHRFRQVARQAYQRAEPSWRRQLDAYAAGVNAGLGSMDAPPFEYLMLRASPEAWRSEDTILTVLAMFVTLQGRQASFEQSMGTLRDSLPEPMFRFVSAAGSEWESPVVGAPLRRPPIPPANVFNLRDGRDAAAVGGPCEARRKAPFLADPRRNLAGCRGGDLATQTSTGAAARHSTTQPFPWLVRDQDSEAIVGSNNWAVDGAHSADGGALVANDMHLAIGVPIIWYRAVMIVPDPAAPGASMRLAGVTLPGLPSMVVGSNGHVAWGFTNSGGDWSDLIRIDTDPRDAGHYLTPDGPRPFEIASEVIAASGAAARTISVRSTIWGPVVAQDAGGRALAQRWVAHDPEALKSDLSRPERARSVEELLAASAGLGIPNQNLTMADTTGRIAWTIAGMVPKRVGLDGFTPESWADGARRWDGYLAAADFPRITEPRDGRIWTANAPVVDGAMLRTIGEGGYADGIRARIIRDRLRSIERATPRDLLGVQLDDRALFLERWRELALTTLAGAADGRRAEFRRLVETTWTGRASPESVAYRLVRTFRSALVRDVMLSLTAAARDADASFDYTRTLRGEGPVWQLLTERPLHMLDAKHASWNECILAAVDAAIAELTADRRPLGDRTWGEFNRAQVFHPLASAVPGIHRWLNMPGDPLPGDVYTPRAHSPRAGPSERMVVSPGRETDGILHMPTGQSGHPLSPHYADMHRSWVRGEVVPFLPGPTRSTLRLLPAH
jgi:penicillin amidase